MSGTVVAVTGAAGFIGARLVSRLAGEGHTVLRVVRTAAPPPHDAFGNVQDVCGDITEGSTWDRIVDADVIFHLAAQTSVGVAAENPERDFRANVMPMRHLLAACRDRRRTPLVLFAGTVTEAGVPDRLPVNEDAPDRPITIYDRHKLIAEQDLKGAASNGEVRGATLRLANVYGPGAHGRREDRDILNRMIVSAMIGKPLTVYGTGENLRDYVFVEDVVDAFLVAAANADCVSGRHFVIGSGHGVSIREAFKVIAERVARLTGRAVPVTTIEPPAPVSAIERRNFIADYARFARATGWRPKTSLQEGIDRTIEALTCA